MNRVNCPGCGKPMLPGTLGSIRDIDWTPQTTEKTDWKKYLSWEGVKELCSELTTGLEIYQEGEWSPPYGQIPTYHCPDCQLFLFRGRIK